MCVGVLDLFLVLRRVLTITLLLSPPSSTLRLLCFHFESTAHSLTPFPDPYCPPIDLFFVASGSLSRSPAAQPALPPTLTLFIDAILFTHLISLPHLPLPHSPFSVHTLPTHTPHSTQPRSTLPSSTHTLRHTLHSPSHTLFPSSLSHTFFPSLSSHSHSHSHPLLVLFIARAHAHASRPPHS